MISYNATIHPMLAYSSEPFDSEKHIFEVKWDSTRCIAFINHGYVRLQNRRLQDFSYRFPEITGYLKNLRKRAILDGEVIVLREGKPSFSLIQQRDHLQDQVKIEILSKTHPAILVVFDILQDIKTPLIHEPLMRRKDRLHHFLGEKLHPFLLDAETIAKAEEELKK